MNALLKIAFGAILIAIPSTPGADGTITFLYFASGGIIDRPISKPGGIDSSFTVGIFAGNQVGNNSAIPLATTPIFQGTGLFQYSGEDVSIPGSTPGLRTTLTLKVWDGPSFQNFLTARGEISFITQPLGGPNPNPPPPAFTSPDLSGPTSLIGFHGLFIPEPTTYALAMLGLAAFAISRRGNSPKNNL